jgi:hypothetical protein
MSSSPTAHLSMIRHKGPATSEVIQAWFRTMFERRARPPAARPICRARRQHATSVSTTAACRTCAVVEQGRASFGSDARFATISVTWSRMPAMDILAAAMPSHRAMSGEMPLLQFGDETRARTAERRKRRHLVAAVVSSGVVTALPALWSPRPLFIWNMTASAPLGLYIVLPARTARVDDWVAARSRTASRS